MENLALSAICVGVCAVINTLLVIWLLIQHFKDRKEVIRQVHLKNGLPDGWYSVVRHINPEWVEVIGEAHNSNPLWLRGKMFVVEHFGQLEKEKYGPGSTFYAGKDDTGTTNVLGHSTRPGTSTPS